MLTAGNQSAKVRLAGIDCPEGGQAFGNKAKQFLAAKVAGKRVRIAPETTGRYGRTIGMVFLNGVNINEQVIANRYGWVYRQYCTASRCDDWLKKEAAAKKPGWGSGETRTRKRLGIGGLKKEAVVFLPPEVLNLWWKKDGRRA